MTKRVRKDKESKTYNMNYKLILFSKLIKREGYKMFLYFPRSHSPLMYWKLSGFFMASSSFVLYLTWDSVLSILELKTYSRECFLKKKFPNVLISLACLQSTHRLLRSAIVLIALLISFISLLSSSKLNDSYPGKSLTLDWFLRMKLIIALP